MTDYVTLAESLATIAHRDQKRKKSGDPYIVHPRRVVAYLVAGGVTDEDMLAAAWLHDVVEDTAFTLSDIGRAFSQRTTELVDAMTKRDSDTKAQYLKAVMSNRIEGSALLKVADRLDNLFDGRKGMDKKWLKKYLDSTDEILDGAAKHFQGHPLQILLEGAVYRIKAEL
jgi:(p)ppGpp synthase/HD superfamily hydrolase